METDRWHTGYHTASGFRQFYRDWRPAAARGLPVLALHGSLTRSSMWIALAEAAGSIRMLCPDQRGFGRSDDPGDDTCAAFAADAVALARELLPGRYVIMGHSFACTIALDAAQRAAGRIAAVVLVDPLARVGAPSATPRPPSIPATQSFATLAEAEQYVRDSEEGAWPDATLRRYLGDTLMRDDDSGPWRFPFTLERLRRLRAFTASPASDHDLFAKARAVRCPVLIFRGGASKRFPAEAEAPFLAAFALKPKLVLCPQSGHFPTATETGIVAETLTDFLDRLG